MKLNTTLRAYQQDGVNWLAFLHKYNLHGILCDGACTAAEETSS
jgi:TATA-binding protein-associated factor